ncbi:PaaI family thioesterase [Spongiibacter sp. KMU-166]|uniref:PaaI family thioesterase n=2 Tax=Spongiibacter thalassae TaxID=2721624 RepID=A0ABX1GC31_9GAMM|nr:PaaI family thioesterase [Spongiibacter thalassae]NKI16731.1 PaaI family thioesterase [Spongiibacter thalassae]
MYKTAPINAFYRPEMVVSKGEAVIEIAVSDQHFHSAGAVHGSVYFKMLDDAAFFAANSMEPDYFVLTTSFTTYLTRPVSSGKLKSVGRVVNSNKSQFIAESVVYDDQGREIGRGNGIFMRSRMPLADVPGYSSD